MLQSDYFADRQVTSSENIGYFVLPKYFATYRSRSDNGIFKFNVNHLVEKGIISYFYPVFQTPCDNIDVFTTILNTRKKHEVAILAEGTGQKVLSLKKLKSLQVNDKDNVFIYFFKTFAADQAIHFLCECDDDFGSLGFQPLPQDILICCFVNDTVLTIFAGVWVICLVFINGLICQRNPINEKNDLSDIGQA